MQQHKLKELLVHAYRSVPYYREKLNENGIDIEKFDFSDDFQKIPLLTKKEINENRNLMISNEVNRDSLLSNSTSGSTGEALYFYYDMRSWAFRSAVVIRNQEAIGIRIGDRAAKLWGAPMDLNAAATIRGKIHAWVNNNLFLSSYDLADSNLELYTKRILKHRPKFIISYPGPIVVLAEYLIKNRVTIPSVQSIICSAEMLFPWQKDIIETAFSCAVYNRYGCREFGEIAMECPKREGLHINIDRIYLEILNESLSPVEDGSIGEVVITDLDNFGMPIIRYRTGDLASIKTGMCSCGRSLPLLNQVEGRTLDVVRAPNGNRLGGTFWTLLIRRRPGIKSFQVIQEKADAIILKYVKSTDDSTIDFAAYESMIKKKCGDMMSVDFEEVGYIPKTESGKTRFVISKVKELD